MPVRYTGHVSPKLFEKHDDFRGLLFCQEVHLQFQMCAGFLHLGKPVLPDQHCHRDQHAEEGNAALKEHKREFIIIWVAQGMPLEIYGNPSNVKSDEADHERRLAEDDAYAFDPTLHE